MASNLFFEKYYELRRIIEHFDSPVKALEASKDLLRDNDVLREFFNQLDNPKWIVPLFNHKYFEFPPVSQDGGIFYPLWPASKYLARMAEQAPEEVATIFASMKTDNPQVIADMLDAAVKMPAGISKKLEPVICDAAKKGILQYYFHDAYAFCVHLANGGEVPSAMTLAEALFEPQFENGEEKHNQQDMYWYKEGMEKIVPALAVRQPKEFITLLCNWLEKSIEVQHKADPKTGDDWSDFWRPAIEEHEQNKDYDFAGVMAGFVRESYELAIREGKLPLNEAFGILGKYPYVIFRRLRLHLINEFAEGNPDLIRQNMMNRELFEDSDFIHEYARLMGKQFSLLSKQDRAKWFEWIDAGPDMSKFAENFNSQFGREATKEDRERRKEYWQFKKLHWVHKYLEGNRRDFYEKMRSEHGEPEMADLNVYTSSSWHGSESPMTVDELSKIPFEQAVQKVIAWKPTEKVQPMGPDREGLASTFGEYIATNPEDFSKQAKVMIAQPGNFVRSFLEKMAEAIKQGKNVDVPTVLELCQWVMQQPFRERTTPEQPADPLVDTDWQWARRTIADLLESVCKAMTNDTPQYPLEGLRETIWGMIDILSRDHDRSSMVHDFSKDDPRTYDYLTLAMNSPRGKAVETALEYARWIANHIKRREGKMDMVPGGFDAMPEVRKMLEWQIESENASYAAFAIIGSRIGLIYWIDKAWLADNAIHIFNLWSLNQNPPVACGWSAWNAFLVWVGAHIEFYKILKEQFAYAVRQAANVQVSDRPREQPMCHLGEHLMILYGRGQLGLEDDNGLVKDFLTKSKVEIRTRAITFVGQSLERDGEKLPPEVVERFKALWEFYWESTGKADAKANPNAHLFGSWFASGQFPEKWSIEQLEKFVEVVPAPEPSQFIVEHLAKIGKIDIERTVCVLDKMVHGDKEGWRVSGWHKEARKILEVAIESGGPALAVAKEVIDFLVRRDYKDLEGLWAMAKAKERE